MQGIDSNRHKLSIAAHHLKMIRQYHESASTSMKQSQQRRGVSSNHLSQYWRPFLITSTVEIQYMYSKAPINKIQLLDGLVSDAMQTSHHWKLERSLGEPTTDCLTTMTPIDPTQDMSITLWVGPESGVQMIKVLNLGRTWSS